MSWLEQDLSDIGGNLLKVVYLLKAFILLIQPHLLQEAFQDHTPNLQCNIYAPLFCSCSFSAVL